MTVKIGAYSLCDGTLSGGVAISDQRPQTQRTLDEVVRFWTVDDGTTDHTIEYLDRSCRTFDYVFQVKRVHANLDAAESFILFLDQTLPEQLLEDSLPITIKTSDESSTYDISNAALTEHSLVSHSGATTIHQYRIVGGQPG